MKAKRCSTSPSNAVISPVKSEQPERARTRTRSTRSVPEQLDADRRLTLNEVQYFALEVRVRGGGIEKRLQLRHQRPGLKVSPEYRHKCFPSEVSIFRGRARHG